MEMSTDRCQQNESGKGKIDSQLTSLRDRRVFVKDARNHPKLGHSETQEPYAQKVVPHVKFRK